MLVFSYSNLEILKLDLANPSTDLEIEASIASEARYSKLIWSEYSTESARKLLIGGCENSKIVLYDYERILSGGVGGETPIVSVFEKHTGAVGSLDLNPFQPNLLASGAGASDIYIWDLNNPSEPMTPGTKLQPPDDVSSVAFNKQVAHIMASTCNGKCVVWDLRKSESIIKVSDHMSKASVLVCLSLCVW